MLVPGIGINFHNGYRFTQIDQQAAILYIILKKQIPGVSPGWFAHSHREWTLD